MEIIQLPGYTQEEKLEIARRYLVGRQIAQNGLKEGQIEFSPSALQAIIRDYTREAGVRSLEREIGAVCRRVAVEIAEGTRYVDDRSRRAISPGILGPGKYDNEVALRTGLAGVATGLAWTPVGGDILFIEASRTGGDGKLILTGQLGDVMKESAQAALTLVKTRAAALGIDAGSFDRSNVHVHVPAGAIPKDGPSAGSGDVCRPGIAFRRPAGAQRHRDDRRDQPARTRPAGGRNQGQGAGRHARRDPARAVAGQEPPRPRGSATGGEGTPRNRLPGERGRRGGVRHAAMIFVSIQHLAPFCRGFGSLPIASSQRVPTLLIACDWVAVQLPICIW
jgi:hypothetical protein